MTRILDVVRLHLVVKQTFVWLPLIILGGALALTAALVAIIPAEGTIIGAAQAPLWYFFAIATMAQTRTFPFSQALSITRREYLLGTMLTGLLASTALAALYTVLGLLEQATDGWGRQASVLFFDSIGGGSVLTGFAGYLVLTMGMFAAGFGFATVYKRFGTLVVSVVIVVLVAALIGLGLALGLTEPGRQVASWLATAGAPTLVGCGALLTALVIGLDHLLLRRAQP